MPTATAAPTINVPTPVPTSTAAPAPTSTAALTRYTWTVSFQVVLEDEADPTAIDDLVTVQVDRQRDVALMEFDDSALPISLAGGLEPTSAVAYVDGVQLSRGFDAGLIGWRGSGEPDPHTWYEGRQWGSAGLPDILPPDLTTADLYDALELPAESGGRIFLSEAEATKHSRGNGNLLAGLQRADAPNEGPLWLEVTSDEFGRVSEIRMSLNGIEQNELMSIDVEYETASFDVPLRDDAEPVPNEPDPVADALMAPGELLLRMVTDRHVVLTSGHKLIVVPWAYGGDNRDDPTYWQLTEEGAQRLLTEVINNPAVAAEERTLFYERHVALEVGGGADGLRAQSSNAQGAVDYSEDIDALVSMLEDPTWLDDDIVSGPNSWSPERLTVIAYRRTEPEDDARAWPLGASIMSLSKPGDGEYWQSQVVCLQGPDVELVWQLFDHPFDLGFVPVDDGDYWLLSLVNVLPFQQLPGDPCS